LPNLFLVVVTRSRPAIWPMVTSMSPPRMSPNGLFVEDLICASLALEQFGQKFSLGDEYAPQLEHL
jgi:hypothetical protein